MGFPRQQRKKNIRSESASQTMQSNLYFQRLKRYHNVGCLSSPSLHRQNGCLCCVTRCATLSLNWSTIGCWIHLPSGQIQQLIRQCQNCQVNQSTLVTSGLLMHANLHVKGETGGTHTQDSDFTQNEHASRTDSVELCQ